MSNTTIDLPEVMTGDEVAKLLQVSKRTVARLALPCAKIGRLRRYLRKDVMEWCDKGANAFPPPQPIPAPVIEDDPGAVFDRAPKRNSRWVYIVQTVPSGKLKIGRALDIEKRLVTLQTATWEGLNLILQVENDGTLERQLHKRFAADRIGGEWFRPSEQIKEWLLKHHNVTL